MFAYRHIKAISLKTRSVNGEREAFVMSVSDTNSVRADNLTVVSHKTARMLK